jgi:hypothetical protein
MKAANLREYGLHTPHDARKMCAEIGLWPFAAITQKHFQSLALVAKENGFNVAGKGGLAVGYDSTCKDSCTGDFKSMDGNTGMP